VKTNARVLFAPGAYEKAFLHSQVGQDHVVGLSPMTGDHLVQKTDEFLAGVSGGTETSESGDL
jgi:hypothetical protein